MPSLEGKRRAASESCPPIGHEEKPVQKEAAATSPDDYDWDDVFLNPHGEHERRGRERGRSDGLRQAYRDGYDLGRTTGMEYGMELGYIRGVMLALSEVLSSSSSSSTTSYSSTSSPSKKDDDNDDDEKRSRGGDGGGRDKRWKIDRIRKTLETLTEQIDDFPGPERIFRNRHERPRPMRDDDDDDDENNDPNNEDDDDDGDAGTPVARAAVADAESPAIDVTEKMQRIRARHKLLMVQIKFPHLSLKAVMDTVGQVQDDEDDENNGDENNNDKYNGSNGKYNSSDGDGDGDGDDEDSYGVVDPGRLGAGIYRDDDDEIDDFF